MAMAFQRTSFLIRRSMSRLPGKVGCFVLGYRVDVWRVGSERDAHPLLLSPNLQQAQQFTDPFLALGLHDVVEGLAPLGIFDIEKIVGGFLHVRCHCCNSSICARDRKVF